MLNSRWFVPCLVVALCAVADAQTRIPIQPAPKPGATIHVTTTLELSITLNGGATAREPPGAQMQMATKTVLGYTQSNGPFDTQGLMEAQLTIDRFEAEQTLDGIAKPPGNIGQVVGGSLTVVFERGGKLVDIRVPKGLQPASVTLRQLVAAAYGALNFLPAATIAIGETITAPSSLPLRLPGSTTTVPYQTRAVITLKAVEQSGQDRIGRFEQRIESAGDTDQVKVHGEGTIAVNLDRGFVAASATEWTFTGGDPPTGSAAAAQPPQVRGTIKVTVTATE